MKLIQLATEELFQYHENRVRVHLNCTCYASDSQQVKELFEINDDERIYFPVRDDLYHLFDHHVFIDPEHFNNQQQDT